MMRDIDRLIAHYWENPQVIAHWQTATQHLELPEKLAWLDVLRRHLPTSGRRSTLHILDIGTATGWLARLLAELGHQVTAIDQSAGMLVAARSHTLNTPHPIAYAPGDARALIYPDQTFDVVAARYVLSALARPDQALREWGRVLKPTGRLLILEDHLATPEDQAAAQALPSLNQATLTPLSRLPLALASPEDVSDFVRLTGFTQVTLRRLAGQLLRRGQRRGRRYTLAYTLVTAGAPAV